MALGPDNFELRGRSFLDEGFPQNGGMRELKAVNAGAKAETKPTVVSVNMIYSQRGAYGAVWDSGARKTEA